MQMSPVFLFSLSVLSSLTTLTTEHIGSVWVSAALMHFAVLHKKKVVKMLTLKKKKKKSCISLLLS